MEKIKLTFKKINEAYGDIPLPHYATVESAGMDLRAAIDSPVVIKSGEFTMVSTNLIVEIPKGFEIQVRPRSGLAAKHGIGVLNSPGTIDSDYRGEIKVILFNFGKEDFTVNRGDRIAQMVLSRVYTAEITESDELNETKRGEGGFGHSGIK